LIIPKKKDKGKTFFEKSKKSYQVPCHVENLEIIVENLEIIVENLEIIVENLEIIVENFEMIFENIMKSF
jgi:hypothetical protein